MRNLGLRVSEREHPALFQYNNTLLLSRMLIACVPTQRLRNPRVSCASLKLFCCRCRQPLSRSRDAISDVHNAKSYYVMNAKTHIITLWSAQQRLSRTHTMAEKKPEWNIHSCTHAYLQVSRSVQPHKFRKRLSASSLVCECTGLLVSHSWVQQDLTTTHATTFPRLLLRFSR